MATITYTEKHPAVVHLRAADPVLAGIIDAIGPVEITHSEDYFSSLVDTIVGQMISMKAAATIYARLVEKVHGQVTPETILALDTDELRSVGLSGRKTTYIQQLAYAVQSGELDLNVLDTLPDEEAAKVLTKLHGIGPWSVEMLLIFSFGRENVFSPGDGGLTRALKEHYGVDSSDKKAVAKLTEKWSPYCSVASLYLWKTLGNE